MLKIKRSPLPPALAERLDKWQAAVDGGTAGDNPWRAFQKEERKREKKEEPKILDVLKEMFLNKCAYCETLDAHEIEHYWPKSPHSHNDHRGTPSRMFRWDNLLLACHECNGFSCKGAHMAWDGNQPRLLNPCVDDPLDYLAIDINHRSKLLGIMEPRAALLYLYHQRAVYTIERLAVNRARLRDGRIKSVRQFVTWLQMLLKHGPDFEMPSGYTIRQRFIEMLDPSRPYLAPIRQILCEFTEVKEILLEEIPELTPILKRWLHEPAKENPVEGL